jgi:hypothetical protein
MLFEEIGNYRMISQQLVSPKKISVKEMVTWLGAVQAQEYGPTKWGLGIRLPHLNDQDIENDFTAGKILRTHLLRPTWHFVTAEDIRWLLMLTAPRVTMANAYMYRKLELDETVFKKCNTILIHSLQGGKQKTRAALNETFKENKIIAEGHRLSYIMMQAELKGILCSGAREGNEFTYALLEERVKPVKPMSQEEALAELSLRYFNSKGPATVKDFSTWSGLTLTDCRKGIELIKKKLSAEKIGEEIYYFNSTILKHTKPSQAIFLLPLYDELIMGYKDRTPMMLYRDRTKSKKLLYDNMIVSEGRIIGCWRRELKTKSIRIEYDFLQKPSVEQAKAFEKSLARYKEFTGLPVER